MRGRNKPWADAFIQEHENLILKDKYWNDQKETFLEIGMGKGDFILQSCQYFPEVFHIGVEVNKSIFALAMKKIVNTGEFVNLRLLNVDAVYLNDSILDHSIDKIFLNFSDPWPKKRHAKRRLVAPSYLNIYEKLLKNNGQIVFKTDNLALFEYGLQSFKEKNYAIHALDYDYQTLKGDFLTEYEVRFRNLKQPIYRCVVTISKEE